MGWIERIRDGREEIQFIVWMIVGVGLILYGTTLVGQAEPGLIALGSGAIGLPGFSAVSSASKNKKEQDD